MLLVGMGANEPVESCQKGGFLSFRAQGGRWRWGRGACTAEPPAGRWWVMRIAYRALAAIVEQGAQAGVEPTPNGQDDLFGVIEQHLAFYVELLEVLQIEQVLGVYGAELWFGSGAVFLCVIGRGAEHLLIMAQVVAGGVGAYLFGLFWSDSEDDGAVAVGLKVEDVLEKQLDMRVFTPYPNKGGWNGAHFRPNESFATPSYMHFWKSTSVPC